MALLRQKWLWIVVGAGLVLAGIYQVFAERIALRLLERVLHENLTTDFTAELPDGLHVGLCGSGAPLPSIKRRSSCLVVIAGRDVFVVDAGAGTQIIPLMRIPLDRARALFMTHYHSDHIDGLGGFYIQRWIAGGHDSPLPIYGPTGVEEIVAGFNRAYDLDAGYRTEHHGTDVAPPTGAGGVARPFRTPDDGEDIVVWEKNGLKVTAFLVSHDPAEPAVGYRFDYRGRSVVVSGDTSQSENLARVAEGVDLLVHEALSPDLVNLMKRVAQASDRPRIAKIFEDILDYHASPIEAAETAEAVGADYLLLYHIVPPLPLKPLEDVFLRGVDDAFDGPVRLGEDGDFFSLPADSDEIERSERL